MCPKKGRVRCFGIVIYNAIVITFYFTVKDYLVQINIVEYIECIFII